MKIYFQMQIFQRATQTIPKSKVKAKTVKAKATKTKTAKKTVQLKQNNKDTEKIHETEIMDSNDDDQVKRN